MAVSLYTSPWNRKMYSDNHTWLKKEIYKKEQPQNTHKQLYTKFVGFFVVVLVFVCLFCFICFFFNQFILIIEIRTPTKTIHVSSESFSGRNKLLRTVSRVVSIQEWCFLADCISSSNTLDPPIPSSFIHRRISPTDPFRYPTFIGRGWFSSISYILYNN